MHAYDAVQFYDKGFGPRMVSVTPVDCELAPGTSLHPKSRGKAPGRLTVSGWSGVDVNAERFRCHDYNVAKLWRDEWGANVGFVAGNGYIVWDNDQGEEFSRVFFNCLNPRMNPLRRYVAAPKHTRDAFFMRVIDFVGDPVSVANASLKFTNGLKKVEVQILAHGKQAVISGTHPDTRAPYVWNREIASIDDIPVISLEAFNDAIRKFVVEVSELGWTLEGAQPVSGVSAPTARPAHPAHPASPVALADAIAQLKALLALIPNREVPPGEKPNAIDQWLDDYDNWTRVGYASAAFLGVFAATPEALDAWVFWSDGREQERQTSLSVWKSILLQPLKYTSISLVHIVKSLVPGDPRDDFPDLAPDDPDLKSHTPVWDLRFKSRWAFSMSQGFIDMVTGRVVDKGEFSDGHAQLAVALRKELGVPKGKSPSVGDMFLRRPDHIEVFEVTYAPGDPPFVASKDPVLKTFNRWKPTTVVARVVSEIEIKPWLDHLLFVLGTKEERDRFLRWCAFNVQHPELKPNWHYLIMSIAGLGKDTMVAPLKLAFGAGNWKEELIYSLANNFNEVVEHKFLIIGETAQPKSGFVSAHDFSTRLKPLLAQPPTEITINKKYRAPYAIPNRGAVIMFSNDSNPLHLERGSRRVHVVNRLGAKTEVLEYYWFLHEWLYKGGAELAASFLLAYPLSQAEKREFIGGVAPESDDKTALEHQNAHPDLAALEDLIADARKGITTDTPANLVATTEQLCGFIFLRTRRHPSSQSVRTWLLDMERQNNGVRRYRIDPKEHHQCGVVNAIIGGSRYAGRLWLLADNTPDGRPWTALSISEVMAIWKNLPTGKVVPLRGGKKASTGDDFPEDQGEEPV